MQAGSVAQTKARFTGPPAFPARATASRKQRFFTNHETRNTAFFESRPLRPFGSPWCTTGGATRNRRPDHCPRRQAAVFLFTIVHHCSAKKLFCAIVLAPPGRCFPARCGAAWGGYGAAWAAAVPRTGSTACKVFTSHETRNLVFPCPPAAPGRAAPSPANRFFTNHETRITAFTLPYPRFPTISHDFPAFPGPPPPGKGSARRSVAAFLHVVERHGAAMGGMGGRPPPRRQQGLLGFHQPRDTQHGFSLFLRRLQGEQPQARPTGFHESRITSHGLYAFLPTTSRHFPAFPAILRIPPSPGAGVRSPSAAAPATLRAASAASNAK